MGDRNREIILAMKEQPVGPELISPIRATRPTAAVGSGFVYATVIRGLLWPDPERATEDGPTDGYEAYILRLDSSSYTAWAAGTYAVDTLRTNDGLLYKVINESGTSLEPGVSVGWESDWQVQPEINPKHLSRGAVDWRDFHVWFQVGETVPLVIKSGEYYIGQQMAFVGDCHRSVMWVPGDGTDGKLCAVFA